jgi:hypothetical protein
MEKNLYQFTIASQTVNQVGIHVHLLLEYAHGLLR